MSRDGFLVLAVSRCDVDVPTTPATLRISGTIVSNKGQVSHRQSHPKTDRSSRVMNGADITGVHPHMFRRTVATVIDDLASMNLAAELLGHTDPKVTIEHYSRRNEHLNPLTAELLDEAFGPDGHDEGSESWIP